jgi:hypothetical protein
MKKCSVNSFLDNNNFVKSVDSGIRETEKKLFKSMNWENMRKLLNLMYQVPEK